MVTRLPTGPQPAAPRGLLGSVSGLLGHFRWLFMPLGLCALIAVGVHAAADSVDDRLLWAVDQLDAAWDAFWGRWEWTTPLVNLVGFSARTRLARGLALLWELAADLVLAWPALGYSEAAQPAGHPAFQTLLPRPAGWGAVFRKVLARPTTLRLTRPPLTAAVALAGACAVARMVQGAVYLELRGLAGDDWSGPLSRLAAIWALGAVSVALGWRAVLRSLQHADAASDRECLTPLQRLQVGLWGTLVALPLAVAAAVDASPVPSFFR